MGLDFAEGVTVIASGTTSYVAEFSPILFLVAGILIAFGIFGGIIDLVVSRRSERNDNFDDNRLL